MKSWTKLWIAIGFIGITAGCKTINNAGESNLESSKPSRPTSGMPPMPAGAGIIEYVGKLSGPSAETAFNDMRREAKPNGSGGESKLAIGNIEIHCSRTAVSASAPLRGMPSATPAVKYRCEVTELRPAGQRGTPTLPFL
ncbi:MAG: hypothetical protein NTV34_19430, partial [Proteobacteria bacterium]|nr:hypothetical protein [Pseudomonadota bacterium]